MGRPYKIFIVATEPSGDVLGAGLMRAIKAKAGDRVSFCGVGGDRMEAEGLSSIFPQSDIAVYGLFEVLPKLQTILRRLAQTVEAAKAEKPDIVVTIDGPDFSFRVARQLKGLGVPLVHYVAPTVWAWRKGRAKKIAKIYDHLLALFSFEPPYFEKEGLACTFVGHQAVQFVPQPGDAEAFRAHFSIPAGQKILCVLPGSRKSEIRILTPVFGEVLARVHKKLGSPVVVIPTVPAIKDSLERSLQSWTVKPIVFADTKLKYQAFAASYAALATSGTVTLELAMAGVPHLVTQRLNILTVLFYIQLAAIRFFNLVNIFFKEDIVPERMQFQCTPAILADTLETVWSDEALRSRQKEAFAKMHAMLKPEGAMPSDKAAETVLKVMGFTE